MTGSEASAPAEPLFPARTAPEGLAWVERLTPIHVREFAAALSAFSAAAGGDGELHALLAHWREVAREDDSCEVAMHLARTARGRLAVGEES